MKGDKVQRAIIVVKSGMTPIARTVMEGTAPKYIFESFMEHELVVNITAHQVSVMCFYELVFIVLYFYLV